MPSRLTCVLSIATCAAVMCGGVTSQLIAQTGDDRRVEVTAVAGGIRRYEPGKWSPVTVQATNSRSDHSEATLSVYFGQTTQQQFGRRLTVPANSRRTTWLPVRLPSSLPVGMQSIEMTTVPWNKSAGAELLQRRQGGELLRTTPLPVDRVPLKTVAIFRQPSRRVRPADSNLDEDAYTMVLEARAAAGLERVVVGLDGDFLPPHPVMWESFDHLILCSDHVVHDSAGLAALRTWLYRGGRLWIFLDRVSPATVAAILGHSQTPRVVDRVELNDFTIHVMMHPGAHRGTDQRSFEDPVTFVRVVADQASVHCHIAGWPAAFWQQAGDGEVLFVTLGPVGWRPAPSAVESEAPAESQATAFREQVALSSLGNRFFTAHPLEPTLAELAQPLLRRQIGYRIPGRALAWSLLGSNIAALLIGGCWLVRRSQLDKISILLPMIAGFTTAMFLVIGSFHSRSVPPSLATVQLVRHIPETGESVVSGVAAIYRHSESELNVMAAGQGLLEPMSQPVDGTVRRLVWNDAEEGEWRNVTLPASTVQFAKFEQTVRLPDAMWAAGQFGPRGFEGRLFTEKRVNATDALVAAIPSPASAVNLRADGAFTVGSGDLLASGQFLAATVLSDESRFRQEIYRGLLKPLENSRFATVPTLLVWTPATVNVLHCPADLAQHATQLSAIPLWIERTPAHTEFLIPATFIRTDPIRAESGISTAYDPRTGDWRASASRAAHTRLRFSLPSQVLPGRVSRAELSIKLHAPSRRFQIHGVIDGQDAPITEIRNPSGIYTQVVERPEWLALDEMGGLQFSFVVTEADAGASPKPVNADQFTTWTIDYVRLNVRGETESTRVDATEEQRF